MADKPFRIPLPAWAQPPHYDELRDRPCPGWTEYRAGDLDAPCDTCGGRTGWMVAGQLFRRRGEAPASV